jgi:predicted nucleic-acid-binding protein
MIGLDASVIIRYVMQDDPVQSARATRIVENALSADEPGFISAVALAETVWTLRSRYGLCKDDIAAFVEAMIQTKSIAIECEEDVFFALLPFRRGHISFADALIGALGQRSGCTHTLTFDRKAARLPGFQLA